MTTVSSGQTSSTVLVAGDTLSIAFDTAEQAVVQVFGTGGQQRFSGSITTSQNIGPFFGGDTAYVQALRGAVDYTIIPAVTVPTYGTATVVRQLTGDYTITAADDNVIFYATTTIVVTVPDLSPNPQVIVLPPTSGSVTFRAAGSVTFNGSAADVVRNYSTDPFGVCLAPRYGTPNAYGLNSGTYNFAGLSGNPGDNAAMAAALALKQDIANPGADKLTGNHTLVLADYNKCYFSASTSARTIIIPSGLPTYFKFYVGLTTGSGALTVNNGAGVTMYSQGGAYRITAMGAFGEVRCTGDQDKYMFLGSSWVV